MSEPIVNKFGRKPGRGFRPWILIPKVVAVAIYIGGLTCVIGFWFISSISSLSAGDPKRLWIIDTTKYLMEAVVVPGLLLALLLGILLFLQHPKPFWRMRWVKVKLVSLLVIIPASHLFNATRLSLVRKAFNAGTIDASAETQFAVGMILALLASLWIVFLGRHKPRLGQNHALSHLGK